MELQAYNLKGKIRMRIKLAPTNLAILEKLNQDYKIPVTSLANSCIYEKLGDKIKLLNTPMKVNVYSGDKLIETLNTTFLGPQN